MALNTAADKIDSRFQSGSRNTVAIWNEDFWRFGEASAKAQV
jgi:hypothetical protein